MKVHSISLWATVTLAVAIGANTTVFSVANSILIRPLPYPDSERIQWISEISGPNHEDIGTAPDYYRIRDGNRVFDTVAAYNSMTVNWTGVERPEQLDAAAVSASFFRVMGTQPQLGRFIEASDEGSKAPAVVVLSYAFWRSRLASDPHIIGRTLAFDRLPATVIGVMPQGFDYPRGTQVWQPLGVDEAAVRPIVPDRPILTVSLLARRKGGVSDQEMATDLNRLAIGIREEYHVFPTKFRWDLNLEAHSLHEHVAGKIRTPLLVLTGAAALVLLIACVNLANLLLARSATCGRDLAVRMALGASRGNIVRLVLRESLLLALPGGVLGIAMAWLAVRLLNVTQPAVLVAYPPIIMDWRVLAFTLGLTLATALLFGAAPAFAAVRTPVQESLTASASTHTGGNRLRKLLVTSELAVCLILLIGAGLLTRTFLALAHTDLGFRTERLLTFRASPIGPFDANYATFYRRALERLQATPGVISASVLLDVPLSDEDFFFSGRIRVVGRPLVPFPERPMISNTQVSPEFFSTFGVPLKAGRLFEARDFANVRITNYGMAAEAPVLVNEAFARKMFPNEDPVGQRLSFGPDRNATTWTIVGVVGDIRGTTLGEAPPPMIYRSVWDGSRVFRGSFALRTSGDPRAVLAQVQREVHAIDRDIPLFDIKTMDERRDAALAPEQFQLAVIGSFAWIAILLAGAGVYGVVSYLVARRTREIGIRMAMGARPADVLALVVGETLMLGVVAVLAGLSGAWALTRFVRSLLHGVTELDAITFALAPLLLLAIVLVACLTPARHAARIDPMRALREQ